MFTWIAPLLLIITVVVPVLLLISADNALLLAAESCNSVSVLIFSSLLGLRSCRTTIIF